MTRSKKLVIVAALTVVALVATMTGVAVAQNGDTAQTENGPARLLERVCAIYQQKTGIAIDSEALRDAFVQARGEIRDEALQDRLRALVEQGKISQEEADQYLEWWQSRPDVPMSFGFRGGAGFRGMGKLHGWGGLCHPAG